MDDLYFKEFISGRADPQEKQNNVPLNKFELKSEKCINSLINLGANDDYIPNPFESPTAHSQKLKLLIRDEAKQYGFNKEIKNAINLIAMDSTNLTPQEAEQIKSDLFKLKKYIDELSIDTNLAENLIQNAAFSQESIDLIFNLAIKKYENENLEECLCLFLLLSFLDATNSEYWYRAGIAAQIFNKYELALTLYTESLMCNPDNIAAKIFSIECYLNLGLMTEAIELLEELKHSIESIELEDKWISIIEQLELLVAH